MASRNTIILTFFCFYLFLGVFTSMILTDTNLQRNEEIKTGSVFEFFTFINEITVGLIDSLLNGLIGFFNWFGAGITYTVDLSGGINSLLLGFSALPTWLNLLIFSPPATLLTWNVITGIYPSGGN